MNKFVYDLDKYFWEGNNESNRNGLNLDGHTLYFSGINGYSSSPFTISIARGEKESIEIFIAPWALWVYHFTENKKVSFGGDWPEWLDVINSDQFKINTHGE
jgi:hypothetical protein